MYEVSLLHHNWLAMRMGNSGVRKRMPAIRGVVYDLGCGTRPFEHEIMEQAERYVGVDWSQTLHGLHADIAADLNQALSIESEAVDTVITLPVMYQPL